MAREGSRAVGNLNYEKKRPWTIKIDKDGGDNPIYIGKAEPGTLTSETFWQIFKITWDGSNDPSDVQWADGISSFTKEWDERGSYAYS